MYDWYYKFVDLPHIPQDIIDEAYISIEKWDTDKKFWWWPKSAKEVDIVNGLKKNSVGFIQFNVSNRVTDWFLENITEKGHNNIKIVSNTDGDHKGAHTDKTRDYVLIYLLESGSKTPPKTIWYNEINQPSVRERKTRCNDYELLTEISSVTIPLRKWIVLNSRILHGIDQLTSKRISFHIGLEHPFKLKGEFIKDTSNA